MFILSNVKSERDKELISITTHSLTKWQKVCSHCVEFYQEFYLYCIYRKVKLSRNTKKIVLGVLTVPTYWLGSCVDECWYTSLVFVLNKLNDNSISSEWFSINLKDILN